MQFDISIETHDRTLGFDLAAVENSLMVGTIVHVPSGATLEYRGSSMHKSVGIPEILQFIVNASVNVDLALFATWLYDKVKAKPVGRIIIQRRVITEITADTIRQVLEETRRSD